MSFSRLIAQDLDIKDLVAELRAQCGGQSDLHLDSRQIQTGDVFVACPGLQGDGRNYIADALSRGAAAVLFAVDDPTAVNLPVLSVLCLGVLDLKARLGALGDAWYDSPSAKLKIVAITGTNGKTSCAQWLAQALTTLGHAAGVIGTLGVTQPNGQLKTGQLTTPDVLSMHRTLAQLQSLGTQYVVLEASSIGLAQRRLSEVKIDIAVFTNLSHDHLDFHGDMVAYESAKRSLMSHPGLSQAVLNIDDPVGANWAENISVPVRTVSLTANSLATVSARELSYGAEGTYFSLVTPEASAGVSSRVLGEHNVSNLLCVAATLMAFDIPFKQVADVLARLEPVDGRLQHVVAHFAGLVAPMVVVDYAHTPDALSRALASLAPVARARGGVVWCVFGCGGNRDNAKRPLMAVAAQEGSAHCIVTSDNPRDEAPETIIEQIIAGFPKGAEPFLVEKNRAQAILSSILSAHVNDVVLIAGKGHELYQEIAGKRETFDDRQWAQAAFLLRQQVEFQTDSRKLVPGEVFIALKGERFDGHAYLSQVQSSGASAAIVEQVSPEISLAQIALGDTRQALMQLGFAWRRRFAIPVIAVTGSNGKTTTKEMISAILARWHGEDHRLATQGNLNNELGVPLTLLRLREAHRAAVIELGMNHPGEIAVLAHATAPTVALVNNAQREHQEFMESVAAVAHENATVFQALQSDGLAVFPADDEFTPLWANMAAGKQHMCFAVQSPDSPNAAAHEQPISVPAAVVASQVMVQASGAEFILHTQDKAQRLSLPVPGVHNVHNALAAAACCLAAGAPLSAIYDGLSNFTAVKGRMQTHHLAGGVTLIDDTYNANPDSVRAAIDVLAVLSEPTILVLGDMGEVGDNGPAMHAEVGQYAKTRGVGHLVTLGLASKDAAYAFGASAIVCESVEQVITELQRLNPLSVLVKGSRFMRMERIVSAYQEIAPNVPFTQVKEISHAV
jgi:murE/murF fusion protein